jgi:hypothetical protein
MEPPWLQPLASARKSIGRAPRRPREKEGVDLLALQDAKSCEPYGPQDLTEPTAVACGSRPSTSHRPLVDAG